MRLLKVHRILIGSGIAVCLLFGIQQGFTYTSSGEPAALIRTGIAALIITALVIYLYSLRGR